MRYISLCASSEDVTPEVASILAKFPATSSTAAGKFKFHENICGTIGLGGNSNYIACIMATIIYPYI